MFDGGFDLSGLTRYGLPAPVEHKSLHPDDCDDRMPGIIARTRELLSGFQPDRDYVALVGDPLIIAAVIATVAAQFHQFQVLKWDRIERAYYQVTIRIPSTPHIGDAHGKGKSPEAVG